MERPPSTTSRNDTKISIIVPAFNEEGYIESTLSAFPPERRARYAMELIVSDGGSTDGTVEIARRHADKVLRPEGDRRPKISENRNRGARHASGDLLVFIDADTVPDDAEAFARELFRMASMERRNRRIMGIVCAVEIAPHERTLADYIIQKVVNFSLLLENTYGRGWGRGPCQIIWRDAFDLVGGYCENIVFGEDFEIYRRLKRQGRIAYNHRLRVYESPRRYRKYGYWGVWRYCSKGAAAVLLNRDSGLQHHEKVL
jgi:glycosyltransferase involved in cell wall biosynthesis